MNYYPHNLGDYAKKTGGLNQGQHGAYRLLIDACYATENGIEADEIYTISKAAGSEERKNTDKVLRKFFVLRDGRYFNKRIEEEIAAYRDKSAKAVQAANKRWEKPANGDANAYADAMRTDMPSLDLSHSERIENAHADDMLTNNQEPELKKRFPGIDNSSAPVDKPRPNGPTSTPRATTRKSDAAIVAQGKRKGVEPRVGESMEAYESRVRTTRA